MAAMGLEAGAYVARSRALAVLRMRGRALAAALLPAACAVVLFVAEGTGRLGAGVWDTVRWVVTAVAVLTLLGALAVGLVVARARPAVSPTVPVPERSAPDLYRLVRDLADRLGVPAPSAIALTPDCDSWLEDRTHRAYRAADGEGPAADGFRTGSGSAGGSGFRAADGSGAGGERGVPPAPVLVIGSPFLWWMRVAELRAVLAPVVAGTEPSAHPDIAAARRFVRGLDAAVAVSASPRRGPVARAALAGVGWVARLLLRSCRVHAAEMERGAAAAAAERAQAVDYGLRITAQEQVGLAYAGWDRLLTKVALPAWRMGRWPARLDAGVVSALTELSRRDRLADGFASRLGERPACDLLEEPGSMDEAASLLAARLFHGGPAEPGPDWAPVDWQHYPEEVVDRKWRADAARLHKVLDRLSGPAGLPGPAATAPGTAAGPHSGGADHGAGVAPVSPTAAAPAPEGPTLARVLAHLQLTDPTEPPSPSRPPQPPHYSPRPPELLQPPELPSSPDLPQPLDPIEPPDPSEGPGPSEPLGPSERPDPIERSDPSAPPAPHEERGPGLALDPDPALDPDLDLDPDLGPDPDPDPVLDERTSLLAAGLSAELAREEAASPGPRAFGAGAEGGVAGADTAWWGDGILPLFPLQQPRTARELLTDHVKAMVCCAAVDTAGAAPGLDWLDGPSLLVGGERDAEVGQLVLRLVEYGDSGPLKAWLADRGVRADKPVRLV
ncbi:hypothetical protein [Streptomyces sp. SCSIO ZS0520]|uniref:hypothetical protein n=1 Tax=Streptomyces sp. SCSIO ZS0520 TaxID=2892996 RepID=UPI0021D852FB|nr:hypothetical protein [Streptomyces sp. SCSIO ZS0520]